MCVNFLGACLLTIVPTNIDIPNNTPAYNKSAYFPIVNRSFDVERLHTPKNTVKSGDIAIILKDKGLTDSDTTVIRLGHTTSFNSKKFKKEPSNRIGVTRNQKLTDNLKVSIGADVSFGGKESFEYCTDDDQFKYFCSGPQLMTEGEYPDINKTAKDSNDYSFKIKYWG